MLLSYVVNNLKSSVILFTFIISLKKIEFVNFRKAGVEKEHGKNMFYASVFQSLTCNTF